MRWVRITLLYLALAAIAVRDPGGIASSGVSPHWLLLAALLAGLVASPGRAVALAWAAGLVVDLLSLDPLGFHAVCYGVAAWLLTRIRRSLYAEHLLTQAALGASLAFLVGIAVTTRLEAAEPALAWWAQLPQVAAAALATGALLPLLARAERHLGLMEGFREKRIL